MLPTLTPARQASTQFTYPGGMESWVDLGGWLYIPRWFTCPQTVTHPSKNKMFVALCEHILNANGSDGSIFSAEFFLFVNMITHEPLHLAWWHFARTRVIMLTDRTKLGWKKYCRQFCWHSEYAHKRQQRLYYMTLRAFLYLTILSANHQFTLICNWTTLITWYNTQCRQRHHEY